ncbi:MAG: DUF6093 family protein [Bifidobacterium tsurumiense]|uniref:DUF6093 family protein n=1 Tax=Bifidobacterium tsurumiense TaxID=356829 RepID=UPI002A800EEA|nr:DUF6093 family protein [Bifidobacterium tsurumiense]MDY4677591.1 DUF6093 family protein [Bifidobacterium tsurumiense]
MTGMGRSLKRMRLWAESLMQDEFRIVRNLDGFAVDEETGATIPNTIVVYEGKGKVQSAGGSASMGVTATGDSSNVGGVVPIWQLYLHLPLSATGLEPGDVAECVSSVDPDLEGRRFRLMNMQSEKSHATARRWNVRETPKEVGA